jgi:hypothetical protein
MTPEEIQRIKQTLGEVRDATHPDLVPTPTEAQLVPLRTKLQDTMRTLKDAGRIPPNEDVPDMSSFTRSELYLGARGLLRSMERGSGVGGRRRKTRKGKGKKSRRMTRKH